MSKKANRAKHLSNSLLEISQNIESEIASNRNANAIKKLRSEIAASFGALKLTVDSLDPVSQPNFVFEPSNPLLAGKIAGIVLLAQPKIALSNLSPFYGSGVYALYYKGAFESYSEISGMEHPIYIGKADPRVPTARLPVEQETALYDRLIEHTKSINQAASTLRVEDFEVRALVVQSGYQHSVEYYLIDLFKPIWNSEVRICYGFGKHGDLPKTRKNSRSPWDTLHPGRQWAADSTLLDKKPNHVILREIKEHFSANPPMGDINQVLKKFLAEMR